MKNSIITSFTLVATLGLGVAVMSQSSASDNQNHLPATLEKKQEYKPDLAEILKASPAAQTLEAELKQNKNPKAILEAGKSGDKSLIPYLKFLSERGYIEAQAALVQLGDDKLFKRILEQTGANEKPLVRLDAIKKLVLIDNKVAYQQLYDLLDDAKPLESGAKDLIILSPSAFVRLKLGEEFGETPKIDDSPQNVALWKQWFIEKNLIN